MKNRKRQWTRIGLALLILGAVLFGIGFATGGPGLLRSEVETRVDTYAAEEITVVRIYASDADVRVERADGDAVEALWFEGDREGVTETLQDGVLTLSQYDERKWYEHITFDFGGQREIVVRVPGDLAAVDLQSISGDVRLTDVDVLGDVKLNATSGKISVAGNAGSLELSTVSGDIDVREMRVAGDVTLNTTSGEAALSNSTVDGAFKGVSTSGELSVSGIAAHALSFVSVSGDIDLTGVNAASGEGKISVVTTSGDVEIADATAAAYGFVTVSGRVSGVLPGTVRDYTITTETVSGGNSLPAESYGGRRTIDAATISGDIRLSFEDET